MTIEESLEWLTSRKEHYEMDDNCQELAQALDVAINTMRKYQKIEEIVNTWRHDITAGDYHCMAEVAEVFEDGKID